MTERGYSNCDDLGDAEYAQCLPNCASYGGCTRSKSVFFFSCHDNRRSEQRIESFKQRVSEVRGKDNG